MKIATNRISEIGAQSRHPGKLDIDFVLTPRIGGAMRSDHDHSPEAMIEKLLLAAGFLMEETSPELARQVEPTREALEARIEVVERTAREIGAIARTARAILRQVPG